ncbi:acyl-CoA carboxylase subunit epsilon [Streptomyces purpurogeneiscleroticus]|uniref:acyl-CoA carboxylase subunit epsilon n=1 Tax=Streptomyces purpurogeneiscleroticus TaxID=68259 RepID=UPI001CC0B017|nr:acyl-CoA carboxylase subunit epsilon [Streptomyces purpurogeneiscleroticus]MBZ4019418.1 hypothetical protein [Streptomyces purpurogeneiscleroticus]
MEAAPAALRVVRGNPTPDELAALIVVVLARAATPLPVGAQAAPVPVPGWLRVGAHHPAGPWRTLLRCPGT